MTIFKTTLLALASISLLAPLASANYVDSGEPNFTTASIGAGSQPIPGGDRGGSGGDRGGSPNTRYLDGSSTATFFYRKGVRNFERGNMAKAEKAFEAVLRTNGLDRLAYFYLAKINAQKNDFNSTRKYIEAYHSYGSK